MPLSFSAATMSAMSPSSANWRADRLTAMHTGGRPSRCQATFCAQAVCSTQLPIGTIRPVSSATGMNLAGATVPRSGCRQRSSASTPVISFVLRSSFAW